MSGMVDAIGFSLIFFALTLGAWTLLSAVNERLRLRSRLSIAGLRKGEARSKPRSSLAWLIPPALMDRAKGSFEERCSSISLRLTWQQFATLSFCCSALGLGVGILHFQNATAAALLAVAGFIIPDQVLAIGAGVYRDRTNEQLQLAIQIFSAEYQSARNVLRAFMASVPQLPDPIRSHFAQATRRLSQGEDHGKVLDELARQLRHPYARLFCRNCKKLYEDQQAGALFEDLAHELGQARIRQRQNQAAVSSSRTLGVALNLLIVPAYLINNYLQPDTKEFLTQVGLGRILIVLIVLVALVTFALNHVVARSEGS